MTLVRSFEKSGNLLFKYRGQIPVILFLLAIPAIALTPAYNRHFTNAIDLIAVLVSTIGFLIRAYTVGTTIEGTSGRNTQNQIAEYVNSKGIYSIVRHPLYLGNYLIWIGIVIFTLSIWFVIIVSLLFWLYYERIMIAEEAFLEKKFGEEYIAWTKKVPAFFPKFTLFKRSDVKFSLKRVLRREYSGLFAAVIGFQYVDLFREYFSTKKIDLNAFEISVLSCAVILTLVLRYLKKFTAVLK